MNEGILTVAASRRSLCARKGECQSVNHAANIKAANIVCEADEHLMTDELIEKAASLIKTKKIGSFTVGDVGCALITDRGNVYTGVCVDTSSGMGFCAEHTAIGP
jgi:hypothetical protein